MSSRLLTVSKAAFTLLVLLPLFLPGHPPITLYHAHPILATAFLIAALDASLPSDRVVEHRRAHTKAFMVLIMSIGAIYVSRWKRGKPHFATLHSQSSILIMVLLLFQMAHGIAMASYPKQRWLHRLGRIRGMPLHRVIGWIVLGLSWWTAGVAGVKESRHWMGSDIAWWLWWTSIAGVGLGVVNELKWERFNVVARRQREKVILRRDSGYGLSDAIVVEEEG